jgi:hypothetical protein
VGGGADPITQLMTQGVLGVVCVLLLFLGRTFYSKIAQAHQRELAAKEEAHTRELAQKDAEIAALRADRAALDQALAEQTRFVRDAVVPAMTRATDISREYVELLQRRAIGSGA